MGQAGEIKKARIVEGGVHLVAVEVVLVVVWISSATSWFFYVIFPIIMSIDSPTGPHPALRLVPPHVCFCLFPVPLWSSPSFGVEQGKGCWERYTRVAQLLRLPVVPSLSTGQATVLSPLLFVGATKEAFCVSPPRLLSSLHAHL